MASGKRENNIEIFEDFRKGLKSLMEKDKDLFSHDIRKEAISGRLAMYLSTLFSSEWHIDIATDGADLLVWDRHETIALALFISRDYISQKGKERARAFHLKHRPMLTLAFSILDDKEYILIYRFEELFLDYIHIFPNLGFEEKVLKRVIIEEDQKDDPTLFVLGRRRRRRKKAAPAPLEEKKVEEEPQKEEEKAEENPAPEETPVQDENE